MAVRWGQSSLLTPACCPLSSLATGMGRGQLLDPSWAWVKPGPGACDNLEPHDFATGMSSSGTLLVCPWVPACYQFALRHPGCDAQLCHRFPHTKNPTNPPPKKKNYFTIHSVIRR